MEQGGRGEAVHLVWKWQHGNGETIVAELIFINEALEASPQKLDPPQRLPQSTLTLRKKAFS